MGVVELEASIFTPNLPLPRRGGGKLSLGGCLMGHQYRPCLVLVSEELLFNG
jgi:hypothetical protein